MAEVRELEPKRLGGLDTPRNDVSRMERERVFAEGLRI
jgi:hypothetical protein